MSEANAPQALESLPTILCRSFPAYLKYAPPFTKEGQEEMLSVLNQIAEDQQQLSDRVMQALRASGKSTRIGDFPMEYTDLHDLRTDYLVRMAIEYQKQDIAVLEDLVDELRMAPMAQAYAEEALGLAKGHLESLQELTTQQPA